MADLNMGSGLFEPDDFMWYNSGYEKRKGKEGKGVMRNGK
jgi:hypothetical protein